MNAQERQEAKIIAITSMTTLLLFISAMAMLLSVGCASDNSGLVFGGSNSMDASIDIALEGEVNAKAQIDSREAGRFDGALPSGDVTRIITPDDGSVARADANSDTFTSINQTDIRTETDLQPDQATQDVKPNYDGLFYKTYDDGSCPGWQKVSFPYLQGFPGVVISASNFQMLPECPPPSEQVWLDNQPRINNWCGILVGNNYPNNCNNINCNLAGSYVTFYLRGDIKTAEEMFLSPDVRMNWQMNCAMVQSN